MNKKGTIAITFIIGVGVGIIGTRLFFKKKYEQIAQEEIDSVKESYLTRKTMETVGRKIIKGFKDGVDSSINQNIDDPSDIQEYRSILKEHGYIDYSQRNEEKKEDAFVDKPYVIPPEEFGEYEEYERISLTYYSDGVLAEENDEEVDDVDEVIGVESLTHFGEYEDDSVFVRNDRLKCDYEILLDHRKYTDVVKQTPHRVEE